MSDQRNGGIAWTDATWNPVTGCAKVSPGCANCYAETVANRFWAQQYPPIEMINAETDESHLRPREFTDVQCHEDRLDQPLRWRKPRKVFVNSMSDLFHPDVPYQFVARVMDTIIAAPQHTFQVLTKRADRMLHFFGHIGEAEGLKPPDNLWLGVSVENQHCADERIPLLLQTPAAVRFISAEPLLGPIGLALHFPHAHGMRDHRFWVIVGGESGPKARPCDLAWVRSLVSQCQAAVPVFVKQLGAHPFIEGHATPVIGSWLRDRKGGDPSEWPEDLRVREFPKARP
ncbi:MAG: phage Gp37/Gp68 family protein [Planctomycetota bacterium]